MADADKAENLRAFSLDRTRALEMLDARRYRIIAATIAITGFIAAIAVSNANSHWWLIASCASLIAIVAAVGAHLRRELTKSLGVVNAVHMIAMREWVRTFDAQLLERMVSDNQAKHLFREEPGPYSHLDPNGRYWFGPGVWPNFLPLLVSAALILWIFIRPQPA